MELHLACNKTLNLKVVTLNVWGIRYVSKHVSERIGHLIKALNEPAADFDIIALQEVWSMNDYAYIRDKIATKFPHAHYFQSGLVGSGCCLFSKHLIEDVFHHVFTLNGYPHKVHHGDWYAGKCVGMARVKYSGLSVNVYTTHLHANYSRKFKESQFSDEYLAHRMTQLFELGQFIQKTSHAADLVLLMGDLNTEESEDGFKMLVQHAGLVDAFKATNKTFVSECHGATCHAEHNCYQLGPDIRKSFPKGLRIDYVLFRGGRDLNVECSNCKVCFGKVPGLEIDLNYSDHEGVSAEFVIEVGAGVRSEVRESSDSVEAYERVQGILKKSYCAVVKQQVKLVAAVSLLMCCLFCFNESLSANFVLAKSFVLAVLVGYLIVYCVVIQGIEKVHLNYTLNAMQVAADAAKRKRPDQVGKDDCLKKLE